MLVYKLVELTDLKIVINVAGSIRTDESLEEFDKLIMDVNRKVYELNLEEVILDFEGLHLINSSAIGKLLQFNKNLSKLKIELVISGLSHSLNQIFRFARIQDVLSIRE